MNHLGEYLKAARNEKGLSLYKVYESTGITNSRLFKAENGAWDNLKLSELKKLAVLYEKPIIPMCMMAGFFDESDMEEYHSGFRNVDLLGEDDKQHVQAEIDFILTKKEGATQ
jgi:transcriptional regulator with XRE-family HTH domain